MDVGTSVGVVVGAVVVGGGVSTGAVVAVAGVVVAESSVVVDVVVGVSVVVGGGDAACTGVVVSMFGTIGCEGTGSEMRRATDVELPGKKKEIVFGEMMGFV